MLILYNPPSSARRKPVMPLSLLALGALLEGQHDYCIVDGNLEARPIDALDRLIREHGATMLGVTVMPGSAEYARCERTLVFRDGRVGEQTWQGSPEYCSTFRRS